MVEVSFVSSVSRQEGELSWMSCSYACIAGGSYIQLQGWLGGEGLIDRSGRLGDRGGRMHSNILYHHHRTLQWRGRGWMGWDGMRSERVFCLVSFNCREQPEVTVI